MSEKLCEYDLGKGVKCGMPAVCAVKVRAVKGVQIDTKGKQAGLMEASQWTPMCIGHKKLFPDHEGFWLRGHGPDE